MPTAVEILSDSAFKFGSHAQLHELLLTIVFTAVAAAVTAWWTSSAATSKQKMTEKGDAPSDVQSAVITEVLDCADGADSTAQSCSEHGSDADIECQSIASEADVEIAQVEQDEDGDGDSDVHLNKERADDSALCPVKQDDDQDEDSDVDVDSWRTVAGRFAATLSLASEDEDGCSMLWSAHYASRVQCGVPGTQSQCS